MTLWANWKMFTLEKLSWPRQTAVHGSPGMAWWLWVKAALLTDSHRSLPTKAHVLP